jgi:hypothetical protein
LVGLPLFFVLLENRVCLSRGVQMADVAWCAAMRIVAEVGDLVQRTTDRRTGRVLGGRAIERSGGAMCGLHYPRGDEERGFLGRASKPMLMVCEWFDLKATRTVCECFDLKTTRTVCEWFWPQNYSDGFLQFDLKTGGSGFSV